MMAMNNSLINLLHCQQQTQNDTIHALYAIQQSQRDHTNDPHNCLMENQNFTVKSVIRQQFSLVPTVTHAAIHLMHRYQQKIEILQEFLILNLVNVFRLSLIENPRRSQIH